jgi:hypothetical protein
MQVRLGLGTSVSREHFHGGGTIRIPTKGKHGLNERWMLFISELGNAWKSSGVLLHAPRHVSTRTELAARDDNDLLNWTCCEKCLNKHIKTSYKILGLEKEVGGMTVRMAMCTQISLKFSWESDESDLRG